VRLSAQSFDIHPILETRDASYGHPLPSYDIDCSIWESRQV